MASQLSAGEFSDITDKLSNSLETVLTEQQRERLSQAFPSSAQDGYEGAGDTANEAEALAQAAATGGLTGKDGAYASFYARNPDIREALSTAAANAFDQSTRDSISELANSTGLSEAYSFCSRGEFQAAAEAANLDSISVSTANECRNAIATSTDYAESLFTAFKPNDDPRDYTAPEYDS